MKFRKASTLGICLIMFVLSAYSQNVEKNMVKFGRMLQLIENYYVDTANVNKLTEEAIVEVLRRLDPHSVYISKEDLQKMNEPLEGSFDGIGISFDIIRDTLLVVSTIPGGPSEKAGVMSGDKIIFIDNKNITGIGLKDTDVTGMLRGRKGTRVDLKISRLKRSELIDFTIIRDKIPMFSLDAAYMMDKETGYIKLNRFSATTTDEFKKALGELNPKRNLKNLVLDLRRNGGGFLNTAIEIANEFLDKGDLIVFTKGVHERRNELRASQNGGFLEGRLVILIDEGSASASEIVAGAVQDWDRGIIVGRRSYGKGLVQKPFSLADGSAVRLTTSYYYTPSGRSIQKPFDKGYDEYRRDYMNRFEHGELFSKDSIVFDKNQQFKTLKNNRSIYGGGGVMPDIFVPMDTSVNYRLYNTIIRQSILDPMVFDYMFANKEKVSSQYKDFDNFLVSYKVDNSLIDNILDAARKAKITMTDKEIEFSTPIIRQHIKALIARDLYGQGYYYQVVNEDDKMIEKVKSILSESRAYENILSGRTTN